MFREARRVAMIEKMVDIGMTYGVHGYLERNEAYPYGDGKMGVWCKTLTKAENSVSARTKYAQKTIDSLSDQPYLKVKETYKFVQKKLRGAKVKHDLTASLESRSLDDARSSVLVELFRLGNEQHPAFARLAAAKTLAEVTLIEQDVKRWARERQREQEHQERELKYLAEKAAKEMMLLEVMED